LSDRWRQDTQLIYIVFGPLSVACASQVATKRTFWLVRYRGPIFFFLIVLSLAGIYAAQQVPISVFPETNFLRVVIGVDCLQKFPAIDVDTTHKRFVRSGNRLTGGAIS
jgi:hypothetical protein